MSAPLRILLHNWRDPYHPEGGGAEKYMAEIAKGLAGLGHTVTIRTAAYAGALPREKVDGVRYVRKGNRYAIYPRAIAAGLLGRYRPDVVIDVQNGIPYLSPLVRRVPVVNLVHHVHKEQWPVVFGPVMARTGWLIESRLSPAVYRCSTYVAVSDSTRRELSEHGVALDRIHVIHNGTDAVAGDEVRRSATPMLVVLGRLVPQKRVEYALDALAALRGRYPDLRLVIVGSGWWAPNLVAYADQLGVSDAVEFTGHVSEAEKHRILAEAWIHLMPSLKEGWGLVVVEAGVHGTPTIAFAEAGGPTDSIRDEETGLLVHGGSAELTGAIDRLLGDNELWWRLSRRVVTWVARFQWDESVRLWDELLHRVTGRP
ncbi:putative glycosyltransferase [Nostocoides australiense Ben110]|uniref:Putative glycosyltransferase n=1 Tax=Nostocoides australiense Ben110 TaxID=1193182 RepID=W6JUE0_9MICO|nr:glycosyltransferase family 4 protein [Tetrasphaera australiensis]CCH72993.1 putative glycosyltransferase [Tetrasphaera australiensis Ben110]